MPGFVWQPLKGALMTLQPRGECWACFWAARIDERLNITEPLRLYLKRQRLPEVICRAAQGPEDDTTGIMRAPT